MVSGPGGIGLKFLAKINVGGTLVPCLLSKIYHAGSFKRETYPRAYCCFIKTEQEVSTGGWKKSSSMFARSNITSESLGNGAQRTHWFRRYGSGLGSFRLNVKRGTFEVPWGFGGQYVS
jgi:hypothetical protein